MTRALALALAGVALLAAPAAADPQIPPAFRGEWCAHGPYFVPRSEDPTACKPGRDEYMRVTASGYYSCKLSKVERISTPTDAVLTFICEYEEQAERVTQSFTITPGSGSYGYRHKRLYIDDLDEEAKR